MGNGEAERHFDAAHTAIVLLEFQRQWTDPGPYRRLIAGQLDRRAVIPTTAGLVLAARAAGALVVHAPLVLDPAAKRGAVARLTRARVFTKGTRRSELTPGLWADGDVLVQGRTAFDAFVNSTLESQLRARGRERLLVGGFATDQCVARTLRTAAAKGFEGWLLSDCSAALSEWRQLRMQRRFAGRVVTAADAARAFGRPATGPPAAGGAAALRATASPSNQ